MLISFPARRWFEIYEVREMLEGVCARLAVRNTRPKS